jgi:DNA-binding response OmpR family regulator
MDDNAAQNLPPTSKPPEITKKILLVEDDEALADVYVARLQAEGYDIKRAADGEESLRILPSFIPDLVLLDLLLPGLSGFEVLTSIRSNPSFAKVKVVVLTSLDSDENRERALTLGADEYMVKSKVVLADVIEKVKHYLGT